MFIHKVMADDTSLIHKEVFNENCAPKDRLATISIDYYDFDGISQLGTITTLDTIVGSLKRAFRQLYRQDFPILTLMRRLYLKRQVTQRILPL
ncbi:hypothetical protein [Shewanella surugensis]|uniref:Uncharacterized protein n=1 Tax=Shewanella surugensis TaxID=212020 RepID=A0ABT0LJ04_9GAMM|nr:hypothetical protein [Shewanella surugensis]MCL1127345.1 hypothetical protein [Shewanella surugensis]